MALPNLFLAISRLSRALITLSSFYLVPFPYLRISLSLLPAVCSLPLPSDTPASAPNIDAAPDAWAESISGISPLILLIGERNAKQLLRTLRGPAGVASLAFAPLGLVSVMTSMVRLCGSPKLRAYLGYEHEARAAAALEVTRVNCGGLHALVVDGHVLRAVGAVEAVKRAVAVAVLRMNGRDGVKEGVEMIERWRVFEEEKRGKKCAEGIASASWCFRVVGCVGDLEIAAEGIAGAFNVDDRESVLDVLRRMQAGQNEGHGSEVDDSPVIQDLVKKPSGSEKTLEIEDENAADEAKESIRPTQEQPPLAVTFLCTFEAISELSTITPPSKVSTIAIAVTSLVAMLGIQILSVWQEDRKTIPCVMVVAGYICIVLGVTSTLHLMRLTTNSAVMPLPPDRSVPSTTSMWTIGLLNNVNTTDSMDTSGSPLLRSNGCHPTFEAVWLREQSELMNMASWMVAVFLTLAFVCHYLGLRSSPWWLSISELAICLSAAFARSLNKTAQATFEEVTETRLENRCYSTGVLDVDSALRKPIKDRVDQRFDLRMYSTLSSGFTPQAGDKVAWVASRLSRTSLTSAERILQVTGMALALFPAGSTSTRHIIVSFTGGVLTEQGLAFPNARMCLAFTCHSRELATPTPLLLRAIMRQREWMLGYSCMSKENMPFLKGLYITSFDSLTSWWTFAEGRNGLTDQHKNLHGSFILISTAFFIALWNAIGKDRELVKEVEREYASVEENLVGLATLLEQHLRTEL